VRSEAIISGSAAFLAPEMGIVPLSTLPPTILMRSMRKFRDGPLQGIAGSERLYDRRRLYKEDELNPPKGESPKGIF
jgi:hypothetical protein